MTSHDRRFLREIGIEPFLMEEPGPVSLPPPRSPETPVPALTERDARWLQNLRVAWEPEPEPGFAPPSTLGEYLVRFPNGIREAAEIATRDLGIAVTDSGLGGLARDIVGMFLDFAALDLEDIVAMYAFHPPARPGESKAAHFRDYIRLRVAACVPIVLKDGSPDGTDW
jgi:hypothetical protein